MITAVDSSVLIDVFTADPAFGAASREALRACRADGGLVACEVVWAEVSAAFDDTSRTATVMEQLGIRYLPLDREAAARCGQEWRRYRSAGGSRRRVIADFLIGAHAAAHAKRLLTRDRGFFRSYFTDLVVLDPRPEVPPQRQ
ncbi:MAG: type II toxin-antitoxin system VapC family toxin [Pseudonocardiaceae bacterium]